MDDTKLIDTVNRSGFPLQIKAAALIEQSSQEHAWRLHYLEHAWRTDHDHGFIDLVLQNAYGTGVMVLECKRVLDSSWIFLVPDTKATNRRFCKPWISRYYQKKFRYFDWHEMAADPPAPLSAYCVVDGEDSRSKPMLERVASEVVSATEAIATEESTILVRQQDFLRAYFPVIVTTAKLKVCEFDPLDISIADGKIDKASLFDVPFVRFQKQLSIAPRPDHEAAFTVNDFETLVRAKENSVFIVNSEFLVRFLREFYWDGSALQYLG